MPATPVYLIYFHPIPSCWEFQLDFAGSQMYTQTYTYIVIHIDYKYI